MWESKDQTLDVNYNTDHIWFDGINDLPVQKPAEIRKWEESKCHKLVEKTFPTREGRQDADRPVQHRAGVGQNLRPPTPDL